MHLYVDGVEHPVKATQRLFQRNPFPAGHRYRLVIQEPCLKWFRTIRSAAPVPFDEQQNVFLLLEGLLDLEAGESEIPARYLLNSVESVQIQPEEVAVEGVCSEVIQVRPG